MQKPKTGKKKTKAGENRRLRKREVKIKELRQKLSWIRNVIHRRDNRRKKGKMKLKKLKQATQERLNK